MRNMSSGVIITCKVTKNGRLPQNRIESGSAKHPSATQKTNPRLRYIRPGGRCSHLQVVFGPQCGAYLSRAVASIRLQSAGFAFRGVIYVACLALARQDAPVNSFRGSAKHRFRWETQKNNNPRSGYIRPAVVVFAFVLLARNVSGRYLRRMSRFGETRRSVNSFRGSAKHRFAVNAKTTRGPDASGPQSLLFAFMPFGIRFALALSLFLDFGREHHVHLLAVELRHHLHLWRTLRGPWQAQQQDFALLLEDDRTSAEEDVGLDLGPP